MRILLPLVLVATFILGVGSYAEAAVIDWAGAISDSNVPSAVNALGEPDGVHASFYDTSRRSLNATYSEFGVHQNADYNRAGFAALLGVSESILAESDFFTAEFNGGNDGTYESGLWEFGDGVHLVSVNFVSADPMGSGYIAAYGNIDNDRYADFFGFSNQSGTGRNWAFLLFDVDGNSQINTSADSFRATLTAANTGSGPTDPDPDVMGRIEHVVPEPCTMLLFGIGGLAMATVKRRKKV